MRTKPSDLADAIGVVVADQRDRQPARTTDQPDTTVVELIRLDFDCTDDDDVRTQVGAWVERGDIDQDLADAYLAVILADFYDLHAALAERLPSTGPARLWAAIRARWADPVLVLGVIVLGGLAGEAHTSTVGGAVAGAAIALVLAGVAALIVVTRERWLPLAARLPGHLGWPFRDPGGQAAVDAWWKACDEFDAWQASPANHDDPGADDAQSEGEALDAVRRAAGRRVSPVRRLMEW